MQPTPIIIRNISVCGRRTEDRAACQPSAIHMNNYMALDGLILEDIPFTDFRTKVQIPYTEYLTHFHNVKEQSSHAALSPAQVEFCFSLKFSLWGATPRAGPPALRCNFGAASASLTLRLAWLRQSRRSVSEGGWWSRTGSNRRPPACKAGALPIELRPHLVKKHRSINQSDHPP